MKRFKPGHQYYSFRWKICTCCDNSSEKTLLFEVEEELPDDDHPVGCEVLDHHRSDVKQCIIEYHENSWPQCLIIPVNVVSFKTAA